MKAEHAVMAFALTRKSGDERQIVGYGLVLPDGSACAVSWPAEQGTSFFSTDTAEQCAVLRDADLMWIT